MACLDGVSPSKGCRHGDTDNDGKIFESSAMLAPAILTRDWCWVHTDMEHRRETLDSIAAMEEQRFSFIPKLQKKKELLLRCVEMNMIF